MLRLTQLAGFGGKRRLPIRVSARGRTTSGTSNVTYTFSSVDIGDADSTRIVVVGVVANDASSTFAISSATIGGVAATVAAQSFAGIRGTAILYAAVPTGASGTIAITFDETISNSCSIYVWAVYNASPVPVDSGASFNTATSMTLTPACVAGGVVLAQGMSANTGSNLSYSAGVDIHDNVSTGDDRAAAGSRIQPAASGALSVTLNTAGGSAAIGLSLLSLAPL